MLYSTVEEAWSTPEPDWAAPKLGKAWSGSWGSQRTVIFSGLECVDSFDLTLHAPALPLPLPLPLPRFSLSLQL
jgi:hypothetical protein